MRQCCTSRFMPSSAGATRSSSKSWCTSGAFPTGRAVRPVPARLRLRSAGLSRIGLPADPGAADQGAACPDPAGLSLLHADRNGAGAGHVLHSRGPHRQLALADLRGLQDQFPGADRPVALRPLRSGRRALPLRCRVPHLRKFHAFIAARGGEKPPAPLPSSWCSSSRWTLP